MLVVTLCAWLGLAAAQQPSAASLPPGEAAAWEGGSVRLDEFSRFLGRTFRGKLLGKEALHHLLQIELVEREAEARGLSADEALVEERFAEARRQTRESGFELEEVLAERSLSASQFRKLLRDSLLHEAMVRQDLGLEPGAEVSQEALLAWTEEHISELLGRAAQAPAGYALDAPPFRITEAELGAAIRMALGPARLREYLHQLVLEKHVEQWARADGAVLTDDQLEAEIEWRRRRVAENPAFQGASYEALLQTQGSSLEAVRKGAELRAAGYLRLYALRRFDDAWFAELSDAQRADLENQHGEARQVAWLLLRAVPEKVDPLDLDFEEAASELRRYAADVATADDFHRIAGRLSEHEPSRVQGGRLGWLHRNEPGVDPAVCDGAFALEAGRVSEPLRTREGMALLFVTALRPRPDEERFRALVRRGLHDDLRREILDGIGLRTIYDE